MMYMESKWFGKGIHTLCCTTGTIAGTGSLRKHASTYRILFNQTTKLVVEVEMPLETNPFFFMIRMISFRLTLFQLCICRKLASLMKNGCKSQLPSSVMLWNITGQNRKRKFRWLRRNHLLVCSIVLLKYWWTKWGTDEKSEELMNKRRY